MEENTSKTVIIPLGAVVYAEIIDCPKKFQNHLDSLIEYYPEIFPIDISSGYILYGWAKPCKKISIKRRRIFLKYSKQEYLIHPCFVLPYLKGITEMVSKGLRMRKYNLPYHVIADTFGQDAMYWYRMELSLASNNIVGTTIKCLDNFPVHILVDEHHDKLLGQKVYVCTTVANDCFLGAALSANVTFDALKDAYGVFKKESQLIKSDYMPVTINMDGFQSTKQAIQALFPDSATMLCFLHGYLKIENNAAKRYAEYFNHIADKVWLCYHAENKRGFSQRIRRLEEWTHDFVPESSFKNAIIKLCKKKRISQILRFYAKPKNIKYA